jgi:hypothetical protein
MSSLSVLIEGNKDGFNSKSAVEKFKDYVKKNSNSSDLSLLNTSNYVKPNYKLKFISKNDTCIKYNITNKDETTQITKDPNELKDRKQIFNAKLKLLEQKRTNVNVKNLSLNKDTVPKEISDEYKKLMKVSKVPVPEPLEILKNPEQHKPLVMAVLHNNITAGLAINHPYKKYFTLLAKHLGIGADYKMPEMDNIFKSMNPEVLNTIAEKDADTESDTN